MVARLPMRWRKPMAQAREIAKRRTAKGRANAIHVWALMVKEAFCAEVPVRDVPAGMPGADMDAGARATLRGADGAAAAGPDGPRVSDAGGGQARIEFEEAA